MATPKKIYDTVSKNIVLSVFKYFKEEAMKFPPNHPQRSYVKKTAEATRLPQRTISWLCQSPKSSSSSSAAAQTSQSVTTPAELPASSTAPRIPVPDKILPPATWKVQPRAIIVDDFDKCVIRRKIQEFYTVRKQLPTIDKLLAVLREDIGFKGSRETLRRIVRALGFRKVTCQPDRNALIEKDRIVNLRAAFLRKMKKYREERRNIVYLDETWIDTSYPSKKIWQSDDAPGIYMPYNKGQRLIVIHAVGETGFVPRAKEMFNPGSASGDYHGQMDGGNFEKWYKKKLLPNLPPNSIIVMDNASYHSVQSDRAPTTATQKADIQAWLRRNNIQYGETFLKAELLALVKQYKSDPRYRIYQVTKEAGHTVLRLPPYHCDLNPIEMIWAQLKHHVAANNVSFKLTDVQQVAEDGFKTITAERWRAVCEHVKKVEAEYWARDNLCESEVEKLVINLAEDSSSEED